MRMRFAHDPAPEGPAPGAAAAGTRGPGASQKQVSDSPPAGDDGPGYAIVQIEDGEGVGSDAAAYDELGYALDGRDVRRREDGDGGWYHDTVRFLRLVEGESTKEGSGGATRIGAGAGARVISVTIRPRSPLLVRDGGEAVGDDEWATLEGKEHELFRAAGDVVGSRYRLPDSALRLAAPAPSAPSEGAKGREDREVTDIMGREGKDATGRNEGGRQSSALDKEGAGGSLVLHQEGDVLWAQIPLDKAAADRVAAAAAAAAEVGEASSNGVEGNEGVGGGREVVAASKAIVLVTVRFLLVVGEWEDGAGGAGAGAGREVRMPVSVRFPLSACPA